MPDIRACRYLDCYFNNNFENTCLKDSVTVSATGECESKIYCDDYQCHECDKFDVCKKQKKEEYLKSLE